MPKTFLLIPTLLISFLAGCTSPNSGFLLVGEASGGTSLVDDGVMSDDDDDDAVSDDDDAVGDDDDAVSDDDDDVGDDDDTVVDSPLVGRWEGLMAIISDDQSTFFCEGSSEIDVQSDGRMLGSSDCYIEAAGGDFVEATFEYSGSFDEEGDWREGTVTATVGGSVQTYATGAAIVNDQGTEVFVLSWPMTLNTGGSSIDVFGVVNAYR